MRYPMVSHQISSFSVVLNFSSDISDHSKSLRVNSLLSMTSDKSLFLDLVSYLIT